MPDTDRGKKIKNNAMGKDHKNPAYKQKGHSDNFNKTNDKPNIKKSIEDCCFCIGLIRRKHISEVTKFLRR